jgi:hypothetical protein
VLHWSCLEHVECAEAVGFFCFATIAGCENELGDEVEVGANVEFGVEVGEDREDGGCCDCLGNLRDY